MVTTEIPIGAKVIAKDNQCGNAVYVILDPIQEKVTHLVVEESDFPFTQRLVPIQLVRDTSSGKIELESTTDQLKTMDKFVETELLPSESLRNAMKFWPYAEPIFPLTLEHLKIPEGEIAVCRGTDVRAKDGPIGRVDELMIDRHNGSITHLILRTGHLWGQKDISIPVSKIEKLDQDTICLKLSKKEVEALPEIPIHRIQS